ncbi:substrate-binding domain-containing protein [Chroococcidiopsis sp. FACHB-1243]|uniref:serine/threonine-protein kinase n=1 Tax=Chroococcidiopsis sp. [FACHB-1243] TaxID=2692781 RepID=UPI00177C6368|nr:serine/threonine-protein kinase [Chroococcidiopsis sp. [FACHB-1243]]MBD2308220.1 substrate-binding domain-containing protein [Chroococcidiopsis sp. [FACHB-1243]]
MSIVCSRGHQVAAGARFCSQCGELLQIVQSQPVGAISLTENDGEPLQPGTCLHERYIIQRQLGQGGFGRTYLAEDMGRFREKFAIKEFMPSMRNTTALKKAEELFQREAAMLHQLEHPQIPRFWQIFRQEGRIFLVLDYVDGPTYKDLLEHRLEQGQCFSEIEILELLQNLLPVLSYLHRRGVVHRDIAPDNIILRREDSLPVLIDMGGVKQVAIQIGTQLEAEQNLPGSAITCVGKIGYCPEEQLYFGIVAPHSDLYALAITILVLMTGKKPQQLLDPDTLQWSWEQELKLSPLLAKTLNRMLAQKPANRFQSADEILQVLNPILPVAFPNEHSRQLEIPQTAQSGFPQPSRIAPKTSQSLNGDPQKHRFLQQNFLKQNWRIIASPAKFLVPALLVIAGGLTYFFWKNYPTFLPQPVPAELADTSGLQLRNSIQEVQNVPSGLFNYGGAHTFAALTASGMNDAIAKAHPDFHLRYTEPFNGEPGSGTGIKMLIDGELSIAQSARSLEEGDYNKAKVRGLSLEQIPVAIDGVIFYTPVSLPVTGLSIDQLQAIFRGKVTNWQQVGGPNVPIVPVGLDPKTTSVLKLLLGGEGEDVGSNVQIVRDYTTAIRKVAATQGGISYGSAPIFANQKSIRPIALAKANTKQYVQPLTENREVNAPAFIDGTYPMTRRLFIMIRRDRSVDEKAGLAYVNMVLSKEGQEIVKQAGFVPIR